MSAITYAELRYGAEHSADPEANLDAVARFSTPLAVPPFDAQAAQRYGSVRQALERTGMPIGSLDMLIAGHALALNAILVTRNTREFSRVTGLRIESWSSR